MATNDFGGAIERRESRVESSIPLGEIIGIAIGGTAIIACAILLVVFLVRRHDRRERKKIKEVEDIEVAKQTEVPLQTFAHPKVSLSERSSFIPFPPAEKMAVPMSSEWLQDESMMDSPPMTKAKAKWLSQKGIFQIPGLRDSWPLAASMPNMSLRLLQPNSSMVTLNQVGGGGYVVPPEPKWPRRTYSRKSRTKIIISTEDHDMQRFSTGSYDILSGPRRPEHTRRSVSENQLSTILRSTSERLKAVHRKSLSRTLTTFGRSPGSPPADRLKTPRKPASASREGLVEPESDDAASAESSVYDSYLNQTPSPARKEPSSSGQNSLRRRSSATPSAESVDSLYAGPTPDLVIPAALTSPSKKKLKSPQRHAMRISSANAKDLSTMIHQEGRASALELGTQGSPEEKAAFTSPHRISLTSDPFYSFVKSSKRDMPQIKIIGPRPLYIRQTSFGQEATAERPASFASTSSSSVPSPLRNISGNAQSPPRPSSTTTTFDVSEPTTNPFSWEPQEAITTRTQSIQSLNGPRRRGYKRTHVVRISLPQRPPSVCPVPEETDKESSPLRFSVPLNAPMRVFEPTKSPSPKPSFSSSQRLSILSSRPPSITTFNPVLSSLSIPELAECIRVPADNFPTLGSGDPLQIHSPTLCASNYYAEGRTSEDDFFNTTPVESASSLSKSHIHQKQHTIAAFPHPEHKELFSFPPLTLNLSNNPRISLPPLRPSMASSVRSPTSPVLLTSPQSLPPPPVLTQPSPAPSHLNGPRSELPKRFSSSFLGPRDSLLHQSICMLRHMNSEVSRCSTTSNDDDEGRSPPRTPPKFSPEPKNWGRRYERQSRGSKAYLSMGMGDSPRKSRIGKRQSARRELISEKQKIKEEDEEGDGLVEWERHGLESMKESKSESPDVTPEKVEQEVSVEQILTSPVLTSNAESGRSTTEPERKDSLTTEVVTPTSPTTAGPLKIVRWFDATPPPTIRVIRHESQLLQSSPQNPPTWGWRASRIGKDEVEGVEDIKGNLVNESQANEKEDYGNWNRNFRRPDSLGLYDSDGFLKCSPGKEGVAGA